MLIVRPTFFRQLLAAVTATTTVTAGHVGPMPFGATTQYHSQDEWGQYAYGYSGGPSAKHEQRTADGVTRGGYSYVDANGLVQSVSYVSDPVNGFRAAGTNLPVDKTAAAPVPAYYGAAPPVPVYYAAAPPVVHHAVPAAEPVVVVEAARHAPVSAVPYPVPAVLKTALTPADTSSLSPHPILLAGRKKRSVGPSVVHHAPGVATSYTNVVRHDPPAVKHYAPVVYAAAPAPVHVVYAAAPAPAPEPAAHVVYVAAPAPAPAPAPLVYAAAPAPAPAPAHVVYAAAPAPVPVVAHVAPSQYHAQDEHGQYTYGYADGESAKAETRYADGTTKGSYSYVDDRGAVQAVHYTAGADGFRAAGTNIPVHHV